MSTKFDWFQYEEVPSAEKKSFDWSQYEEPVKDLKKKSGLQEFQETPEYIGRGGRAGFKGAPRAITGLLKHGSKFLQRKGQEQAEKEGREVSPSEYKFTESIVKAFGLPDKLLEKIGLPTFNESLEKEYESRDKSFEVSPYEKGVETAGSFLGGAIATPMSSFGTGGRALNTGLAAVGVGAAAGLGGGPGEQTAAAIGLPALVKMLTLIKTGKLTPSGSEAKQLYEQGKKLGLTDKELTPILQPRFKKDIVGKIAQPTRRAERAIAASEGALGSLYEKLKDKSTNLPRATYQQEHKLMTDLDAIVIDLKKSKMKGPDKESAINKIEEMMQDINSNGIGADEIIATWQDVNDAVNWKSIKNGKKVLERIKKPMAEVFGQISPNDYKEFQNLNKMYGKLQDTASKVKPSQISSLMNLGEGSAVLKSLYDFAVNGNSKSLMTFMTYKGARLLATEALTNPRLNNLMQKTIISATSGSKAAAAKAIRDFEEALKEYPEIEKEISVK